MLKVVLVAGLLACAAAEFTCKANSEYPSEVCFDEPCTTAIKTHIKEELNAAFAYMHMGAHFGQSSVALPGMSSMLLSSASEERSHATLMLDYLNKRGVKLTEPYTLDKTMFAKPQELTMQAALKKALEMEITVTSLINNVITACANDYHAADVFTNPILEEQHDGVRKLQGALRAYDDLVEGHDGHTKMAEWMLDQKILNGGL